MRWKTDDCGSEWVIFFFSRVLQVEVKWGVMGGGVGVRRHNTSHAGAVRVFRAALSNIWKCFCFCSENFWVGKELE